MCQTVVESTYEPAAPALPGAFAFALQFVQVAPASEDGEGVALLAAALVAGDAFDLSRIERLSDGAQAVCLELFEYCLSVGLSEEERQAVEVAFEPFVAVFTPGVRH